jgi:hypothetical protein
MIKEIPQKQDYVVVVTSLRELDQAAYRLLVEIIDTNNFASNALSTYEISLDASVGSTL